MPLPGPDAGAAPAPTGLLVELTGHPELAAITDTTPEFSWVVNAAAPNTLQVAYRVLVASTRQLLDADIGDLWDSGKTTSAASVNVSYGGQTLAPGATYSWKVATWDSSNAASAWSASQPFTMAAQLGKYSTPTPSLVQASLPPLLVVSLGAGHSFFDFGRAAFGWVELTLDAPADGTVVGVNLGEKAKGQAVDLSPGGTVRSAHVQLTLQKGVHTYRVATPKDATNTSAPAIPLPVSLGVVMPFRYVEISNAPGALTADSVRQIALSYPFDDTAASFSSSNSALDQVWAISKYTIKATTFAGIYIDGDRERTPYEADAYIQQLGHYAIDRDYALARRSHEYLMVNPTWPTEWKSHSVMMAWADWMYTGNTESLAQQYALLKKEKTLDSYLDADGLLNTASLRDIVDWPAGERDSYVLTGVNTVVNSFWCHILGLMADMATALGNASDATHYRTLQATAVAALNAKLSDATTGLYVDGQTTTHSSLHANMFPLAFGLVPANRVARVLAFVKSRGMACSVYGAQYLLESLYQAGDPDAALTLLTATTDRSWQNMIKVGSTITLEAWGAKYKSNLDWNHAWGAAPANILPRFLLGVRPLAPGFAQAAIQPQPGSLTHVEGTVATIRGPIRVVVDAQPFTLTVTIPANMTANVAVPASASTCTPLLDGQAAASSAIGGVSWINAVGSGQHVISCQ
jgi:alpha-L-rhamnosidase